MTLKTQAIGKTVGTCLGVIYGFAGGTDILNAILLGASGYVGSHLAKYIHQRIKKRWGNSTKT